MTINIPKNLNYQGPKTFEELSGKHIDIRFPNENTNLPGYSFKWSGKKGDGNPQKIVISGTDKPDAFVNTGQFLYDKLVTVFDAKDGWFGTREWSEEEKQEEEDEIETRR